MGSFHFAESLYHPQIFLMNFKNLSLPLAKVAAWNGF
jgi:hypothetical protein